MKVLIMPADAYGCGYYRLIWAAEFLQSQGHDVTVQYPKEKVTGFEVHFKGNPNDPENAELIDARLPMEADVLVMQRSSHTWHPRVIPILRKKGIAVVIDMDDDLSCIDPRNVAYHNYHPRSSTPYSWKHVYEACKQATFVTTSTKSLLSVYAKHGRGVVLDNYVPRRYLTVKSEQDKLFGWAGTTGSHPNDLQVTGGAVQRLVDDGYEFRIIGPPSKAQEALRLKEPPTYTGTISMFDWPQAVGTVQVALAPLAATQFNASKSRLKCIEASAVGVPWVASPRNEYRRLHKESGAGLLADSPKEWYTQVKRLMDDTSLREDLGAQGREYMKGQTIEANAWRWLEAWEQAHKIQKGS